MPAVVGCFLAFAAHVIMCGSFFSRLTSRLLEIIRQWSGEMDDRSCHYADIDQFRLWRFSGRLLSILWAFLTSTGLIWPPLTSPDLLWQLMQHRTTTTGPLASSDRLWPPSDLPLTASDLLWPPSDLRCRCCRLLTHRVPPATGSPALRIRSAPSSSRSCSSRELASRRTSRAPRLRMIRPRWDRCWGVGGGGGTWGMWGCWLWTGWAGKIVCVGGGGGDRLEEWLLGSLMCNHSSVTFRQKCRRISTSS